MPDLRAKALAALRDGRVTVVYARTVDAQPPFEVLAWVASSRTPERRYVVDLLPAVGEWACTCPHSGCAHVAAVQLVTGHASAAARLQPVPA